MSGSIALRRVPLPVGQDKLGAPSIHGTDGGVAKRTLVVCPLCVVSSSTFPVPLLHRQTHLSQMI